jgi:CreA protein
MALAGASSPPIPGLTFGLQQVGELQGAVELEARGARFEGETFTIPGVVSMATFFDPSGNALEIFRPKQA